MPASVRSADPGASQAKPPVAWAQSWHATEAIVDAQSGALLLKVQSSSSETTQASGEQLSRSSQDSVDGTIVVARATPHATAMTRRRMAREAWSAPKTQPPEAARSEEGLPIVASLEADVEDDLEMTGAAALRIAGSASERVGALGIA